jgi:uncharacterized protein YkwD
MSQISGVQRLIAIALAMMLIVPPSAFAEMRRRSQTDVTMIAAQVLQTILSAPHARTSRDTRARRSTPSVEQTGGVSREAILEAMNRQREQRGLAPLRLDWRLNAAANDRIRDMFDKHYFDHVSPDGTQPFVWVKYRSYRYATVGENLAEGYRSAGGVVNGWMNSPGHRRNLLGQSFDDAGVAIVRGSPTGRTNGYTVVALYAREATRRSYESIPPSS